MAKTKAEEKAADKQPKKKKKSVSRYPFKFVEKNCKRISLEGKFQNKIKAAVSGTEHTVTTENGKVFHWIHISGPIVFQTEKKKERAPQIGDKITPKNRHCCEASTGKYSVERNTSRHTEWKTENYPKPDTRVRIGARCQELPRCEREVQKGGMSYGEVPCPNYSVQ